MARGSRSLCRSTTSSSTASSFLDDDDDLTVPRDYKALYKALNVVEKRIGGDSGLLGMSGSVSGPHLSRIFHHMKLDASSHLLDVGAGLGRPMLHALVEHDCRQVSGIEFDGMKFVKAQTVISRILPVEQQVRTCLYHRDVLDLGSLDELDPSITHLFSFWEGITRDARAAIGKLVAKSWDLPAQPPKAEAAVAPARNDLRRVTRSRKRALAELERVEPVRLVAPARRGIQSICFVQQNEVSPAKYLAELGFPPNYSIVAKMPVTMLGSCAQFQAFVLAFHDPCAAMQPTAAAAAAIAISGDVGTEMATAVAAIEAAIVVTAADALIFRELYNEQLASEFSFRAGRKKIHYGT